MKPRELIAQLEKMLREGIISEEDTVTLDTHDETTHEIKLIESRGKEVVIMSKFLPLEDKK